MTNLIKTTLILGVMTGLFLLVGDLLGGARGMQMALVFAVLMNGIAYWFSDKIALMMYRAQPVSREQAPELYDIVEGLASKAGLPTPPIYLIPSETPNAFATGRNPSHAAVAVTEGILRLLSRKELEGVLAHELSHVRNRDVLVSSIAATLGGAIATIPRLAFWFGLGSDDENRNPLTAVLMMILAPLAAMLIQLWISRTREYGADASGAMLAGSPDGLANALEKLEAYNRHRPMMGANPATAHLFIVNPLTAGGMGRLFSTHPPIEERVRRLRALSV